MTSSSRLMKRYLSNARTFSNDGKVGFLGLGNMGFPMSRNLSNHHDVIVFDSNETALEKARIHGMKTVNSIDQVAKETSTIITMLPGDVAINAVMEELIRHLREKSESSTIIDCSTISPTTSRYWNEVFHTEGHLYVDAPVSGGVKGAEHASLTFMVGVGHEDLVKNQNIRPILECMGSKVIPCGGPGAGSVIKLCNNLALATQMIGICEAMNLGTTLGVDPITLANVMNISTAKSWSCEMNNPHPAVAAMSNSPASMDYNGGFGTKLMLKDLRLATSAGSEVNVALPLGSTAKELYELANARGLGNKDFGVMLQYLSGK